MLLKVVLVALVAVVVADIRPTSYQPPHQQSYQSDPYHESDEYEPYDDDDYGREYRSRKPQYQFDYQVKDYYGNDFGHQESRDGYDTKGEYYVLLPDGRRQTVTYYVNRGSGFVADVNFDPKYPVYSSGSGEYDKSYNPRPDKGYRPDRYDGDSDEYRRPNNHRPYKPDRYNGDSDENGRTYNPGPYKPDRYNGDSDENGRTYNPGPYKPDRYDGDSDENGRTYNPGPYKPDRYDGDSDEYGRS